LVAAANGLFGDDADEFSERLFIPFTGTSTCPTDGTKGFPLNKLPMEDERGLLVTLGCPLPT
jgi:hypothetical protein